MAKPVRRWTRPVVLRRVAFGMATLLIAVASALVSFVNVARHSSTDRALAVDPADSAGLVVKADAILLKDKDAPARNASVVRDMARRSLKGTALNAGALRQLALISADAGNGSSLKLLRLSERLSRREFGTQLLLIENAVEKGNLDAALEHYDIALRGSPQSQDLLFPILLGTLTDPQIRDGLARQLRETPPWAMNFLGYLVSSASEPSAIVALLGRAGGMPNAPGAIEMEDSLLSALVTHREYGGARRYYQSLPGSDVTLLSSPTFKLDESRRRAGALEWQLTDSPTTGATPLDGGGIQVFGASGESGIVASKILFLRPGGYGLNADFGMTSMPAGSSLRWKVRCLDKERDRVLWQGGYFRPLANKSLNLEFAIPADCPVSSLDLHVIGGTGQEATEANLESLKLERTG